jgi:hypothetical protein
VPIACPQKQSITIPLNVLDCTGTDIWSLIRPNPQPYIPKTIDENFTSWPNLVNAISNQDHGGKVFGFTGNNESMSSTVISNAQNFVIEGQGIGRINGQSSNLSTDGAFFQGMFEGCNVGTIRGMTIENMRNSGISFGQGPSLRPGCTDMICEYNTFHRIGQAAVVAVNGSRRITCRYNHISEIGQGNTFTGEGFYGGFGDRYDNFAEELYIGYNTFSNLRGEAIDIKRDSTNVLIEHNLIEGIEVHSQGAITLGLNEHPGNINATVRHNIINGVTTRNFDGNGIVIAAGNVSVYGNIVMNTVASSIDIYADGVVPESNLVDIFENILVSPAGIVSVQQNVLNSSESPNFNPLNVTRTNNLVSSNPTPSECLLSSEPLLSGRAFTQPTDFIIN